MIPVKFLNFNDDAPDRGYWDMHFLETLFLRPEFDIANDIKVESGKYYNLPSLIGSAIVVVQGRNNTEYIKEINGYIAQLKSVLIIISSDEESLFPEEKLVHPNMKIWRMTPHAGKKYPNVDKFIGEGYTPHCDLITELPDKRNKWFFAGQITHPRREKCARQLRKMSDGELIETSGFTQGISQQDYIKKMSESKIIPCPGGPVTPDTFRMYEALEMACIPIVDEYAANNKNPGYWRMLFGEDIPFPTITHWENLPGLIDYYNDTFTVNSNKIFAWWQRYKHSLRDAIVKDFDEIAVGEIIESDIVVVVPTSPTKSNPDIAIIEETIKTIRSHLPEAMIYITFDGVREEQKDRTEDYQEYIRRVLWKCNKEWGNCYPIIFDEHTHQVGMMREVLKKITAKTILYVEHDTPITPDMTIEWETCINMIKSRKADLVRFHFESHIPNVHKYLMLDKEPITIDGIPVVRTIQWSQRPHLASTDFYRRILNDHFSPDAKTFIEDKMHSIVFEAYKHEQLQGWNKFKLVIYHPVDGNIKRSYHTDGRGNEQKYSMTF